MTLTLNITVEDEEMHDFETLNKLVNALIALAPKPEQPVETDENGYKVIPTNDDLRQSINDDITKAIEESEKRREARTKKTTEEDALKEAAKEAAKKAEKAVEKEEEKKAPAVSETEVRMALGKLQRTDGGKAKVRAILNGLGAKNFPDLNPAKYAEAFALTVEELKKIDAEDSE